MSESTGWRARGPITAGAGFTCPMHPHIRQQAPGSCPICGMALEPLVVTAQAAPNHALSDLPRRFCGDDAL